MEIVLHVRRISLNISGCTSPIFTTFLPYESALRAHDGSVPYFPICQGTLPWQPNNKGKLILRALHGLVLQLLAINATISCKILVKIGLVVLVENSLTNGTCVEH